MSKVSFVKCENRIFKKGCVLIHDDFSTRVSDENYEIGQMFRSVGADIVALSTCSPELNPIELVFNVMVQRFASRFNESNANSDADVLNLLHSVVDSITPDIIFSCY